MCRYMVSRDGQEARITVGPDWWRLLWPEREFGLLTACYDKFSTTRRHLPVVNKTNTGTGDGDGDGYSSSKDVGDPTLSSPNLASPVSL